METTEKSNRLAKIISTVVVLAIIAGLEYLFFENVLFSDALIGETNDSRLNNLLVEHWFHAFTGKESFSVVNIFYPMPDTVAFTDMLVGFAIPYTCPRMRLLIDVLEVLFDDMRVDLRRGNVRVAQHLLNGAQVRAVFEQVHGKRVAQRMRRDVL